jgi:hypothetical protein
MKRAILLTLLTCAGAALASANVVISNAWNFDGTTDWEISGADPADFTVSPTNDITRWSGAGTWGNRAATSDTSTFDIGGNLGANRRFRSEVDATPAGPAPDGSGNFISFTVTNNSSDAWTIDAFSFGVGRNVQTAAWLYTAINIGATETALTADASSLSSSVAAGGWNNPLVQFGPGSGANAWAKPVYSDIGLALSAGQSADFRIYLASGDTGTFFHLNNLEVTLVPEPATYAALFGLLALGIVVWHRRRA